MTLSTSRRSFIGGLASLIAAPAIVRVGSLMPVRALQPLQLPPGVYPLIVENYLTIDGDLILNGTIIARHLNVKRKISSIIARNIYQKVLEPELEPKKIMVDHKITS